MYIISPSSEIRQLLEKHEQTRPSALICLHPHASENMRNLYIDWCDRHQSLRVQLQMALAKELNCWQCRLDGPAISWAVKGSFILRSKK